MPRQWRMNWKDVIQTSSALPRIYLLKLLKGLQSFDLTFFIYHILYIHDICSALRSHFIFMRGAIVIFHVVSK